MIRYRLFDHTADLGVEVFGATINELFVNSAFALFDLLTNLDKLRRTVEYNVTATGEDLNDLWVNYLRECLYLWSSEGFLAVGCTVESIDKQRVVAKMQGEVFDSARHTIKQEIKAVTYHHASVITTPQGWVGRVIFDV